MSARDLSDAPRYFTRSGRYTSRLDRADPDEPQPLTAKELEDEISAPARKEDRKRRDVAIRARDTRLAAKAISLMREVNALDKEMRAAGVDRQVYRQVAHGTRALQIAGKMLMQPD